MLVIFKVVISSLRFRVELGDIARRDFGAIRVRTKGVCIPLINNLGKSFSLSLIVIVIVIDPQFSLSRILCRLIQRLFFIFFAGRFLLLPVIYLQNVRLAFTLSFLVAVVLL